MKTYLFENGGLAMSKTIAWVKSIDKKYEEINTDVRDYMRRDDLHLFALLIDPKLKNIVTSSAFPSVMPYAAMESFGKTMEDDFKQIEYFAWLMYEAVALRKRSLSQPLFLHINYEGGGFLADVNRGQLGEDTKMYLMLMMRQSEGFITLRLYEQYKLVQTVMTEDELCFN